MFCAPVTCAVASPGQCEPTCEEGYSAVGGKCLKMMNQPANYLIALTSCVSMGATLASIQSQAEQEAVHAMTNTTGAWIGLTDFLDEEVFSWVDGAELGFTNWVEGHHDNGEKGAHCVLMRGDGGWDDVACKRMEAFVCQKDVKVKGPRDRTAN